MKIIKPSESSKNLSNSQLGSHVNSQQKNDRKGTLSAAINDQTSQCSIETRMVASQ